MGLSCELSVADVSGSWNNDYPSPEGGPGLGNTLAIIVSLQIFDMDCS